MSGGGRLAGSEWGLGDAWLVIAIQRDKEGQRGRREGERTTRRAAIAEFYLLRLVSSGSLSSTSSTPDRPRTSHAQAAQQPTTLPYLPTVTSNGDSRGSLLLMSSPLAEASGKRTL